jgi:ribosomal protein L11
MSKVVGKAVKAGQTVVKAAVGAAGGRKLNRLIRVTVPAQNATMQGLGAQLGQHGFKVIEFCQQFNKETVNIAKDTKMPVEIKLYRDRSFEYTIKPPMTSHLIKMAAQGSGSITLKDCYNIALVKTGGIDVLVRSFAKTIPGSARTMNIKVINDMT